jgi:transcriptional antiterminator Rof (Rho-off)
MEIYLDKRAVRQIRISADEAIEEGDTDTLREDVMEAFTEEQIEEIERRIDSGDFYDFLSEMLDEWSGDDVDELFELLESALVDVGIDLKYARFWKDPIMDIYLDKRAVKQIRISADEAIEEGDTDTLREDVMEAFTEEQIEEIERRIDSGDFYDFLSEMLDEWSGEDVDELFELLESALVDVGIDLKYARATAEEEEEEEAETEEEDDADEEEGDDDDVDDVGAPDDDLL